MLRYAAAVDRILQPAWVRSKMTIIQKAVVDQLIADHFQAGSSAEDCAKIVKSNLLILCR